MKNTPKAFTLIELLVVIAIIGLLMAVIMPALGKVKDSAQTLICGTNLRSYGTALQAYAMDNSDKAPFMVSWLYSQKTIDKRSVEYGDGTIPKECRWHEDTDAPDGSLWPYLSDEDVHMCPTFKRFAKRLGLDGCPNASEHSRVTRFSPYYSYSMNYFLGFDWETFITIPKDLDAGEIMFDKEISMKLSRVTRSANCFAFSEENLWPISAEEWDGGHGGKTYSSVLLNDNALWVNANKTSEGQTKAIDNIATYHKTHRSRVNDGSANLVFVDGHVEAMRGRPGREAYETYGKPYGGHDNKNIW